jgi:hypothetical protein
MMFEIVSRVGPRMLLNSVPTFIVTASSITSGEPMSKRAPPAVEMLTFPSTWL